ncbi:serine/threonine-protein kinase [Acanthopleuribacter pedis]|uniref:Tetratricopeptide repeat protein n=1 Tax=Acanthopleuribacter pedis TaxID=442870 RepID=A0A8J7QAK8_9BACT|nr:serine/threonine-protein kinase [Acanthopleuribacter pedis]MBO1320700.1 tetratricopeptide repeat protein [Acanthopleuribacter pedis]
MTGPTHDDLPGWPDFLALFDAWRRRTGPAADAAGFLRWVVVETAAENPDPLLADALTRFAAIAPETEGAPPCQDRFLLWLARCCAASDRFARAQDTAGGPAPADAAQPVFYDEQDGPLPAEIGPFTVKALIGRGGMGVIYLGEREGETRQIAAVKVLQRVGGPHVAAFKKEMRLLASLQHPNIAFFLDHGTTADGRPWLALEYIDGRPLDQWCAEEKPSLDERLTVFLKICDAVGFAHNNLIIHRDLKPNNILIQHNGEPKLLDFGIASLLDPDTEVQQTMTLYQQWACTPDYASPEQLRRERLTAATDVYSLGVLLYELLTGDKPYQVDARTPLQMLECHTAPTMNKPSRHVLKRRLPNAVASSRLRGDLDVICMKALAGDRKLRYPAVTTFAGDLRRYQRGLPIHARPASSAYRLVKFLQRNRVQVVWGTLLVLVLLGATFQAHHQSRRIAAERDQTALQRDRAEQVRDFLVSMFHQVDPRTSGKHSEAISALDILEGGQHEMSASLQTDPETHASLLLTLGEVYRGLGRYDRSRLLLAEALDLPDLAGLQRLELELAMVETMAAQGRFPAAQERLKDKVEPLRVGAPQAVLARLEHTRGRVAVGLGRYQEAKEAFARATQHLEDPRGQTALDLMRDQAALLAALDQFEPSLAALQALLETETARFGEEHPRLLPTVAAIGETYMELAAYEAAEAHFVRAEKLVERHYGREHPYFVDNLLRFSKLEGAKGRHAESKPFLTEALALGNRLLGEDHPVVISVIHQLSSVYLAMGRLEVAEDLLRQGYLDLVNRHGEKFLGLSDTLVQWADILKFRGEYGLAEERLRQALALQRTRDSPEAVLDKAHVLERLARLQQEQGDYAEAEAHFRQVLVLRRNRLGSEHPKVANSLNDLGFLLTEKGALDEAETKLQEALAINSRVFGEEHPEVARTLANLSLVRLDHGDPTQAENHLRRALAIYLKRYDELNLAVANTLDQLASVLKEQERYDEAEHAGRRSVDLKIRLLGEDHPYVANSLNNLAAVLSQKGDLDGAVAHYERAVAIQKAALGGTSLDYSIMLNNVAVLLYRNRDYQAAVSKYAEVLRIQDGIFPEGNSNTASSCRNLGLVHRALGDTVTAELYLRRAAELRARLLGPESYGYSAVLVSLAETLAMRGDLAEAERLFCRALDIRLELRGPDHPSVGVVWYGLARLAALDWDLDRAEALVARSRAIFLARYEPGDGRVLETYELAAEIHAGRGDVAAVQREIETALAAADVAPFDRASLLLTAARLGGRRADPAETERALREAEALFFPFQNPLPLARVLALRARDAMERGAWDEAEDGLRWVLALRASAYGEAHPLMVGTRLDLVAALTARGRLDSARALLQEVRGGAAEQLPTAHPYHLLMDATAGRLLVAEGQSARGSRMVAGAHATLAARLGADHALTRRVARQLDAIR